MSSAGNPTRTEPTAVGTIAFMVLVTAVFIAAVSAVHLSTRERIKLNESVLLKRAVLRAAGLDVPESNRRVEEMFEARVTESPDPEIGTLYHVIDPDTGDLAGCVFRARGAGLWGTIEAMVGFRHDLKTMSGIDFTRQNETPGLGARITEPWFRNQFQDTYGPFELRPEGEAAGPGEMDAITGATITSRAVKTIINRCVRRAAAADSSSRDEKTAPVE